VGLKRFYDSEFDYFCERCDNHTHFRVRATPTEIKIICLECKKIVLTKIKDETKWKRK
jgi:hypothetical protein